MLVLLLLGGCYWSKYDKLTRTHVELLGSMAQKLEAVTREHGAPPASLAEYRYPLERARDFTRIVARRFEGRPSLAAFRTFCDAYEDVVKAAESQRGGASDDRLERAAARLRGDAAAVLAALAAEARG